MKNMFFSFFVCVGKLCLWHCANKHKASLACYNVSAHTPPNAAAYFIHDNDRETGQGHSIFIKN